MQKLLIALFLSLSLISMATRSEAQNLIRSPESVAFDSLRNRYLVSNIANGAIIAVDTSGVQSVFMSGFGMCFGNCMYGDTLFVSNGTNIFGIDLSTETIFMDITMPAAARSYDGMTTDTSGNLYVVYTGGRIHKIEIATQTQTTFVSSGLGVATQDIIFDARNNRLLAAGYSAGAMVQAISIPDGTVTSLVGTAFGYMDGITMDHLGNVYLSCSTEGNVYKYDKTLTNPAELISSGHSQPSGLDFNFRDNILAVPNFSGNSVDYIPLTYSMDMDSYYFDDAVGGDNDGVLEAGETIDLVVSFVNYRNQPITGMTVDMVVEDAAITILNGHAYLGDMAVLDTASNVLEPLQFTIPADYNPRLDSLVLTVSYNGGSEVKQFVIEQGLGAPRILLVDDDDFFSIEQYYIECFSAARIAYDILITPPAPTVSDLEDYEIIIWFTGDYRLPLDGDEIAAMEGYLDGGGNLFLTGQGIGTLLNLMDQDFMNNYLRADYTMTEFVMGLAAETGSQIFALSDTVLITGDEGASNQTDPDHLTAVNGGVGDMVYLGTSDFGAVSYSGTYKSLFFGFGFEAIINGSDRWTDRHTIFAEILDFFEYQRPALAPEVFDLMIAGDDPMHLIDHAPEISWTFSEAGSRSQVFYQIQVGQDNDWTIAEMWDSGPLSGSSSLAVYAGLPLIDGETYYIRVRVSNGDFWSSWLTTQIHMNGVPQPSGLTPDNLQEIIEGDVVLTHNNPLDTEGDEITYAYEIYDDETLTTLVTSNADHPAGTDPTTSWTPAITFTTGEDFFWRVRADDGFETGPWTDLASFMVVVPYICGDANGDTQANVADAVFLINYVFKGGAAPDPLEAGDANCDGFANVADAVYMINYVFKGGAKPCASCE